MKNTKKIQRQYKETIVDSVTCDICKKTFNNEGWGKESYYDVLETTIELREGSSYPEVSSGTTTEFDICPDCFESKLIPTLKELGATPTITEWYY